jgi:hypothetical protein
MVALMVAQREAVTAQALTKAKDNQVAIEKAPIKKEQKL